MELRILRFLAFAAIAVDYGTAFVSYGNRGCCSPACRMELHRVAATTTIDATERTLQEERAKQKRILLGILNPQPSNDPVLADPITKEAIILIPRTGTLFGSGQGRRTARRISYEMKAEGRSETYVGSSETFLNLLEPTDKSEETLVDEDPETLQFKRRARIVRNLTPFIPPPLRSALATAGVLVAEDYVPMRDLFTSPTVSYAYERGWRNSFQRAGFPGQDEEAEMAMEYFEPSMARSMDTRVLVDMSCATGLFTRRFAKSGNYKRVLGCDYSASMLEEARRRIQADPTLRQSTQDGTTRLDLVRLDVGRIPMQTNSVDCLHAGAAMHCWPDLPAAASEIYRVLKPGGRYFATTFSADWFRTLQTSEGGATGPNRQAFNYFESASQLRNLMERGGFAHDKVSIEILAPSCVVIRCEK